MSEVAHEIEILRNAIYPLIAAMIDEPEHMNISFQKTEFKTIFIFITAKKEDVGKIIGRSGKHADALRTLIASIGARFQFRTMVEISPE